MGVRRVGRAAGSEQLRKATTLKRLDLQLDLLTDLPEEEGNETLKLDLFAKNIEVGTQVLQGDLDVGFQTVAKGDQIHYSLGVVLEPETVDLTRTPDSVGDIYSEEEVAKAMYDFNFNRWGQGNRIMHKGDNNPKLVIIESYLAPVDFKVGDQPVKKGTWLMKTLYFDTKYWEGVQSGKFTGLSIGGTARAKLEAA